MLKFNTTTLSLETYQENISFNSELKYIKYGKKNDYDKYLINLSTKSPLHSGILDKKRKMDFGGGLKWDETSNQLNNFYGDIDKSFYTNCFNSLELFGGFYVGIKWFKKRIIGLEYVPFSYARLGEPDVNDTIPYILISKNWKKETYEAYRPEPYPVFTGKQQSDYEIAIVGNSVEGQYYPQSSYQAAITWIEADHEIAKAHLANIKNGFNPGAFIIFTNGTPPPEQKQEIIDNLKNNTGSEGTGSWYVDFVNGSDKAPIITQLPVSDLDKMYLEVSTRKDSEIVISHQIPRILSGLETPGSLGDSKQIMEARDVFYNDYIKYQQQLMEDFLYQVNVINGVDSEVEFINNKTINYAVLDNYKEFLTRQEIRDFLGLKDEAMNGTPLKPLQNNITPNEN